MQQDSNTWEENHVLAVANPSLQVHPEFIRSTVLITIFFTVLAQILAPAEEFHQLAYSFLRKSCYKNLPSKKYVIYLLTNDEHAANTAFIRPILGTYEEFPDSN